ncbi:hypothetical protein GOP47_0014209 [Adiantum capillus-veneris]|uniref:Uncharacterized protein n=1 Tax=Adiantum capillus-veneris TaxID=13818 RepID=A0A9D4URC2_ADICA|nr:hypothetical protein GOP47_0014209 [Adiantum capillus-veneris]
MEESSEKRREMLRAIREEASLADEGGGSSVTDSPKSPGLPLLHDLQQPSATPRFEFYTDPLAAFRGPQRNKKSRSEPPSSPLRQPSFAPPPGSTINAAFLTPNSNPNVNSTPPGSFSPGKHGPNHQPSMRHSGMVATPANFSNSYPYPNHHPAPRGNFHPNSTPPRSFNTPIFSNPASSAGGPRSAPYSYNGTTHGNSPAFSDYNVGRGSLSAQSPPWSVGGMNESCVQSHGSNRSWGSFKQSPGSSNRSTPGKSGGRGFHRFQGTYSETGTPESFAKRSMLEDPWKDIVPARYDSSVASRLDSCSFSGSRDWLPKSITRVETSPVSKGVSVSAIGPSLAESLALSFADAVAGEDGV